MFSGNIDTADEHGNHAIASGIKQFFRMSPDVKATTDWAWGAGNYVVSEHIVTGTMKGKLPGAMRKAKGKSFSIRQLSFVEVAGGKIKRNYMFTNKASMARQLGLM